MKRFIKAYGACLFLMGLLLVLCMGGPIGMVLLVMFQGHPVPFWMLAVLLPAIPAAAWLAWKERLSILEKRHEFKR